MVENSSPVTVLVWSITTAELGGVQTVGASRPNAVCSRVGTFVCQVICALDEVRAPTCTLLICNGSSGGGGVSAYERLSTSTWVVSLGRFFIAGFGLAFTRFAARAFGALRFAWTCRCTCCLTTIGVADTGRSRPGTWRSFGCGFAAGAAKSGGCAPALRAAGTCAWPRLRCAATPMQIEVSATSARMSCRSRMSPLTGITRVVSAWIAHVFS